MSAADRLPTIYIPHGGGPWHVMEDRFDEGTGYGRLADYLRGLGDRFRGRAKSLLMISAHWEEPAATVHFGKRPGMLYDYGGFPDFTYKLQYPAPGDPVLAARVEELLRNAGIQTAREESRGYDHGAFVPLMVAFPDATMPIAQLSLVAGLDPAFHFEIGRALVPLRDEGVLIIGSGLSYHNLRGFMSGSPRVLEESIGFDDWLARIVGSPDPERRKALLDWRAAPAALECHPRSDHLVPLFIVAGAAGSDRGVAEYRERLMGVAVSSHVFGA